MSKSAGNVVAPREVIDKYGAEVLRLWVSAADYRDDVRISPEILTHLAEAYRRIRNTCRYLLGNLSDFDPKRTGSRTRNWLEIDRWAIAPACRSWRSALKRHTMNSSFTSCSIRCIISAPSI